MPYCIIHGVSMPYCFGLGKKDSIHIDVLYRSIESRDRDNGHETDPTTTTTRGSSEQNMKKMVPSILTFNGVRLCLRCLLFVCHCLGYSRRDLMVVDNSLLMVIR